jgi:hypothetical protein
MLLPYLFFANVYIFGSDERFADLDCSSLKIVVQGDVKLTFYDADLYSSDDKMFHLWFNTRSEVYTFCLLFIGDDSFPRLVSSKIAICASNAPSSMVLAKTKIGLNLTPCSS